MGIVAGALIAITNQGLLHWRMQQLKRDNIVDPKKIINKANISIIERFLLIGVLLALTMLKLNPLTVILSFFIINFSFSFYKQCWSKI